MLQHTLKTVPSDTLQARFNLAQVMAEEAGNMAMDYFMRRKELTVETKTGLQDLVSIADRNVESLIRDFLRESYPEDGILGEEHGVQDGTSGYLWVVDPIDGTAAFLHGMPNWCVSIGLLKDNQLVMGVVRVPCDDETFAAIKDGGATLNGDGLMLDAAKTLQNSLTGIGANHDIPPEMVGSVICDLMAAGGNYVRTGSGAQMLVHVAAGRLAGFYEPSMHIWDCLAAYCIVAEAGGLHRDFPLEGEGRLAGGPVLAAGPGAFEALDQIARKNELKYVR